MVQLTKVNDRMSEFTLNAQNATLLHMVQRHRDILQDYSHEFQKTKNNILAVKEREELLGGVYRDNRQAVIPFSCERFMADFSRRNVACITAAFNCCLTRQFFRSKMNQV